MTNSTLPLFPPAADVPVTDPNRITIALVADENRPDFWPQHFGSIPQWITLEPHIFAWMDRLCADYSGGIWCFYTLSNDGAFMAPEPDGDDDEKWTLFNPMNGNGGELSAEASGIAICLIAYSHHAMRTECDAMTEHYYRLHDYALNHAECNTIMHIID
ncbi:antirestriction protein [Klebsiella michiganensis]|uniref:antirestriction protein n=1 Tax=Klebsiella michiganensis TaxID=1134687 RepID=UPI003167688C